MGAVHSVVECNNNNNNIARDEARIIRTLQMMLVGATSLDLNLQEWAKIPIFLNIHSNAKNWIDRWWSVLLERIWIITLALFLMFDKWEEIVADIKTEGYQCVRDYKVRKWTQRDPNWAIKWELLSFWHRDQTFRPPVLYQGRRKRVLDLVTCNDDVCTLFTLQIIQTASKVTKMPWYMK